MSDRDKKLILMLLIIAIVALPYVFVIKDKKVETQTVKAEVVELNSRYEYLKQLDDQREFFLTETENNNTAKDKVIASYPANILQENYTMFLLNTEYSTLTVNEDGEAEIEYPIAFTSVNYGSNTTTPISDESSGTQLGYSAITNASSLDYQTFYPGLKYYLEYFKNYVDPMTITSITATADSSTGLITGSITLVQYAISGEGRELDKVKISPDIDSLDLRGVEELGIFGVPDLVVSGEEEETAADAEDVLDETAAADAVAQ